MHYLIAWIALPLLVVLASWGVGLPLEQASLPDRWTLTAGAAVYGLYMAPIVLTGQTTFAGYTLLGDTSVHFSLIDYVSEHGARLVAQEPSSFSSVTDGQIRIGYPLGLHFELARVRWLLGAEVSRIYQSFLATMTALAVPPVVQLLRI